VLKVVWPRGPVAAGKPLVFKLSCSIDCQYTVRAERAGRLAATAVGRLVGRKLSPIVVSRKLRPGRYRLRVSLVAAVNRGPSVTLASPAFSSVAAR
jgi:hypothetical protein